jgi:predicted GNAT family acetyltransferase
MTSNVIDNTAQSRFELTVDGQTAVLVYERTPDELRLIHTEVPAALRGRGLGEQLVKAALERGRADGLRIVAICPYVRAYLRKHPPSS